MKAKILANITRDKNGCWVWNGYTKGWYANISVDGKSKKAHRVSYEAFVGPIPDGKQIDHLCRNKSCVNPTHLEPVSQRENILRSDSMPAKNVLKTHCYKGHEFTGENTYRDREGNRSCKACKKELNRLYKIMLAERRKSPTNLRT